MRAQVSVHPHFQPNRTPRRGYAGQSELGPAGQRGERRLYFLRLSKVLPTGNSPCLPRATAPVHLSGSRPRIHLTTSPATESQCRLQKVPYPATAVEPLTAGSIILAQPAKEAKGVFGTFCVSQKVLPTGASPCKKTTDALRASPHGQQPVPPTGDRPPVLLPAPSPALTPQPVQLLSRSVALHKGSLPSHHGRARPPVLEPWPSRP